MSVTTNGFGEILCEKAVIFCCLGLSSVGVKRGENYVLSFFCVADMNPPRGDMKNISKP